MVNSASFNSEVDRSQGFIQTNASTSNSQSSSPITASSASSCKDEFTTNPTHLPTDAHAIEPTPTKTDYDSTKNYSNETTTPTNNDKASFFCSVPLDIVKTVLSSIKPEDVKTKTKNSRKILCLFCDRTFVNVNLRQKHVERCHSSKQLRRVSLRKNQNNITNTPCVYCDKLTDTEHTLKDLFEHLILNHSNKYFGCVSCEDRFLNANHLADHNATFHKAENIFNVNEDRDVDVNVTDNVQEEIPVKITRSKLRLKNDSNDSTTSGDSLKLRKKVDMKKTNNIRDLRSKKLSVKSSKIMLKRSKRLQTKVAEPVGKKKRTKNADKKYRNMKPDQTVSSSTKLTEKVSKAPPSVNPYPEFDSFFRVKKITDHSIDNLKISSLTFDDVFDKAFFNRIRCNIQENLMHHIDGKLFKNEESESRISNFEKISNIPPEVQNLNSENYGCELSLNAVTPATSLLCSQFGEDLESQIEYGSKPSKKKTQIKKDEVHYKYFTRRKYQASILEHKENRDLSKLDMWTQYVIKDRQQKIIDDKKSPQEILDYFAGEEYKNKMRREELNRILDRRGPFEDLKKEVRQKAALDSGKEVDTNEDNLSDVKELLDDLLNKVFEMAEEKLTAMETVVSVSNPKPLEDETPEIPSYLNLRRASSLPSEGEIDKSDKIVLICSSQETEYLELPTNTVRGKDEKVELTGEWARSRMFVCAACGLKLQNIKQFLEHKSLYHQNVWVQHYEFVGNQSELYRHLSIPVLGKVGVLEDTVPAKSWRRSEARLCSKCEKQCNSLGELHRHILECGGDWTWMLARKKCKYRPFGAKSRRKRRGLLKRIYTQKTVSEPSEKKVYKKTFDGPRPKPSDAETIQRMLANLPAKRATRKIMCLKDGINNTRNTQNINKSKKQSKMRCGKAIHRKLNDNKNDTSEFKMEHKNKSQNFRRSLRTLNKVLSSRILDTNSTLIVKRKYKKKFNQQQKKNNPKSTNRNDAEVESTFKATTKKSSSEEENSARDESKPKRTSPRIENRGLSNKKSESMNIKRYFPVKKRKNLGKTKKIESDSTEVVVEPEESEIVEQISGEDSQENKVLTRKQSITSLTKTSDGNKKDVEQLETNVENDHKDLEISRKRKLRNSFKKVVEKVKKMKIKHPIEPLVEDQQEFIKSAETGHFLAKSPEIETDTGPPELEKIVIPVPVLAKNEDVADPAIPASIVLTSNMSSISGTIFDLQTNNEKTLQAKGELQFDNHDNSLSVSNSLVPPKPKGKIRKPARGLNDCIAMLTNKLNKTLETSVVSSNTPACHYNQSVETEKQDCILKVPLFNEHFKLKPKTDCSKTSTRVEDVLPINGELPLNMTSKNLENINRFETTDQIENEVLKEVAKINQVETEIFKEVEKVNKIASEVLKNAEISSKLVCENLQYTKVENLSQEVSSYVDTECSQVVESVSELQLHEQEQPKLSSVKPSKKVVASGSMKGANKTKVRAKPSLDLEAAFVETLTKFTPNKNRVSKVKRKVGQKRNVLRKSFKKAIDSIVEKHTPPIADHKPDVVNESEDEMPLAVLVKNDEPMSGVNESPSKEVANCKLNVIESKPNGVSKVLGLVNKLNRRRKGLRLQLTPTFLRKQKNHKKNVLEQIDNVISNGQVYKPLHDDDDKHATSNETSTKEMVDVKLNLIIEDVTSAVASTDCILSSQEEVKMSTTDESIEKLEGVPNETLTNDMETSISEAKIAEAESVEKISTIDDEIDGLQDTLIDAKELLNENNILLNELTSEKFLFLEPAANKDLNVTVESPAALAKEDSSDDKSSNLNSKKRNSRSAKTRALELISGESLLELKENKKNKENFVEPSKPDVEAVQSSPSKITKRPKSPKKKNVEENIVYEKLTEETEPLPKETELRIQDTVEKTIVEATQRLFRKKTKRQKSPRKKNTEVKIVKEQSAPETELVLKEVEPSIAINSEKTVVEVTQPTLLKKTKRQKSPKKRIVREKLAPEVVTKETAPSIEKNSEKPLVRDLQPTLPLKVKHQKSPKKENIEETIRGESEPVLKEAEPEIEDSSENIVVDVAQSRLAKKTKRQKKSKKMNMEENIPGESLTVELDLALKEPVLSIEDNSEKLVLEIGQPTFLKKTKRQKISKKNNVEEKIKGENLVGESELVVRETEPSIHHMSDVTQPILSNQTNKKNIEEKITGENLAVESELILKDLIETEQSIEDHSEKLVVTVHKKTKLQKLTKKKNIETKIAVENLSEESEPVLKETEPSIDSENLVVEVSQPTLAKKTKRQKSLKKTDTEKSIVTEKPTTETEALLKEPEALAENNSENLIEENADYAVDATALRRSRRSSKKIASYNEIDLVDPLLDDLDNDKNIRQIVEQVWSNDPALENEFIFKRKKRNPTEFRKKNIKTDKIDKKNPKLNSDELFDLLKATPSENVVLSKPTNSFFNNFDELSDDFNDDNYDTFENILEKSIAVIDEDLAERTSTITGLVVEKLMEINPPMIVESVNETVEDIDTNARIKKVKKKRAKHRNIQEKILGKEIECKLDANETSLTSVVSCSNESLEQALSNPETETAFAPVLVTKVIEAKSNYCEICNKSFARVESLTKHKRTLTHISKLSELEAKEAELKSKRDQQTEDSTTNLSEVIDITSDSSKNDLNLLDMLQTIDTNDCKQLESSFSVNVDNNSLKLADIINDVLNKPVLDREIDKHNFSDIIMQNSNDIQPEFRRYRSLGERKSFEADSSSSTPKDVVSKTDYFEPQISKTAGTILEKQITLLQNIIENRSGLSYLDDISVSSVQSANEINTNNSGLDSSNIVYTNQNKGASNLKDESFLRPAHYEEISEDSSLRTYEDQKSRKVLNRDEELFLECCSLLKSGSEVSNYSKNSNKPPNNVGLKTCEEPDWLENKNLAPTESFVIVEDYSDASGMVTPLGDTFGNDDSNSNTISSSWNMSKIDSQKITGLNVEESLEFKVEEEKSVQIKCDNVSKAIKKQFNSLCDKVKKRFRTASEASSASSASYCDQKTPEEFSDTSTTDSKKMLTKGAMKVFEGLKVSIPTEDLNMTKLLTGSPPIRKTVASEKNFVSRKRPLSKCLKTKTSNVKNRDKLSSKFAKHKKNDGLDVSSKGHDIYDFEETQDNSDVFTKPDFKSFRSKVEEIKKVDSKQNSDNDSQDCIDLLGCEAFSSSTSSVSDLSTKKQKTDQNITKKKCMIMGRIFKNATKTRIDEDIRNLPIIDNAKLVEDFVLNCPEPVVSPPVKPKKMTEEELNLAFDQLLGSSAVVNQKPTTTLPPSNKQETKNCSNSSNTISTKRKIKTKTKKKSNTNSDSSDDEFSLNTSKKRTSKKNSKDDNSCINLEQELKECIGVASRKSQRKCTSGKQNVLVEYWSSDESSFEALLEAGILYNHTTPTDEPVDQAPKEVLVEDTSIVDVVIPDSPKQICISDEIVVNSSKALESPVGEKKSPKKPKYSNDSKKNEVNSIRRKRAAANPLYHWSSSSEDESYDLIEVKPIRDEVEDDDRPVQHGWIVGDSPKKLVTMLAQAKGKKCDVDGVKEQGKKRTNSFS